SEEHTSELQSRFDLYAVFCLELRVWIGPSQFGPSPMRSIGFRNRTFITVRTASAMAISPTPKEAGADTPPSREPVIRIRTPETRRDSAFFFNSFGRPPILHSFPTRRSSD